MEFSEKRGTIIALILLSLFYGLALNGLLEGGDAERYVILGKSMLERGDLVILSHPKELSGERYGPVYPALIAVFFFFLGYTIYAAKFASLTVAVAAVYASYLLIKELSDKKTALLVALLVAVNPQMVQYSHNIMSESTFTLVSVLALFFVVRHAKNPANKLNLPAAGFFIAASALTKTVGFVLLASVVLHYLMRRDLKSIALLGVFFTVFMSPLYARNLFAFGSPLHSDYGSALVFSAYSGAGGIANASALFASNLWAWISRVIPENIFPPLYLANLKGYSVKLFLEGSMSFLFNALDAPFVKALFALAGLCVTALVFYGIGKTGRKTESPEIYFVVYVLFFAAFFVFALDPLLWFGERDSPRFIIPLLPLAFYYFIKALENVARDSNIAYAIVIVILAASLVVDGVLILKARQGFYIPAIEMQWKAAEWARGNTPEDSVFLMPFSKGFYWYSGRKVVDLESDRNITLASAIREYGVDYAVATSNEDKIRLDYRCLKEVYRTTEPAQVVYKVVC